MKIYIRVQVRIILVFKFVFVPKILTIVYTKDNKTKRVWDALHAKRTIQ